MNPKKTASTAPAKNAKTMESKAASKASLQKELGWPEETKRPVLCLPAGMTDALGGSLFKDLLPGLLSLPIEILVIGKGSQEYGSLFTELTNKHGHRMYIVPDTKGDRAKMYAASDMALFLTDPSNTPEVADCLANGAIPIAPNCKALSNYNPVQESGNSFIFDETDVWHAFAAIVRAVETHRFPFDWRTIQKHCMGSV